MGSGRAAGTEQLGDQMALDRRGMEAAAQCSRAEASSSSIKEANVWKEAFPIEAWNALDVRRAAGREEAGMCDEISSISSKGRELIEVIVFTL